MGRAELLQGLAAAKKRALESKAIAEFHRDAIADLMAVGSDTAEAERMLRSLEQAQTDDLAEMERILNALDDIRPDTPR